MLAGCRAFGRRLVRCRPGYSVSYDQVVRDWKVALADGTEVWSAEVADFVLEPYRAAVASFKARRHATTNS